jgi:acetyltransferase (GNAT) family protein
MKLEILEGAKIEELDKLSRSLGNTPLISGSSLASVMRDENGTIVGFASVQTALHASGSWISPGYRRNGYTYELRRLLESDMRAKKIPVYFAFPGNDFEKELFRKYGSVTERLAQVKEL